MLVVAEVGTVLDVNVDVEAVGDFVDSVDDSNVDPCTTLVQIDCVQ